MRLVVTTEDPERREKDRGLLERIWRAMEREPRLRHLRHQKFTLALEGASLVVEGELVDVRSKKRALQIAHGFPEVEQVVDRVLVEPPVPMRDGAMRDLLRNSLLDESSFRDFRIVVRSENTIDVSRDPLDPKGNLTGSITSGIVTLDGRVPSLLHRRLARLLSWWLPGTRDVRGQLTTPQEDDSDEEINDAVLVALEKDPLVDGDQLGVGTKDGRVTLHGVLPSDEQREIAERDAWYVDGVNDVDNQVTVWRQSPRPADEIREGRRHRRS